MIKLCLEENELANRCEIFQIPDIHDNEKWPAHVREIVPHFDTVFIGNNGLVKELFEKYDDAQVDEVEHEVDVSATKIRYAIVQGLDWEKHVSSKVTEYIREIDGVERIKQL